MNVNDPYDMYIPYVLGHKQCLCVSTVQKKIEIVM